MSKPTESELAILQVLWQRGPTTVRTVNEVLNANSKKAIGYTGTLKLMQLMLEKGLLQRDASSRTHIYAPLVKETDVQRNLLKQFVDKTFRGSATQLVLEALGQNRASESELAEIKRLIEEIEDQNKGNNE